MSTEPQNNYFTAGELAALFAISKQTLLYYDKVKLLSPDYISENGYRHYSIQQYLDLEIIVNMRTLNISISEIKKYLTNRSKENFTAIIHQKDAECENIIKENERIRKSLASIDECLNAQPHFILNQIMLSWQNEKLLRLTQLSDLDDSKNRIIQFAKHSQKTFHNKGTLEKRVGWIIPQNNFFHGSNKFSATAFFSYAPNIPGHKPVKKFSLAAGLYLEIYFEGTFYYNSKQLSQKITGFLKMNKLKAVSNVLVLPIENHWFSVSTDKYINKLFLQVQPLE